MEVLNNVAKQLWYLNMIHHLRAEADRSVVNSSSTNQMAATVHMQRNSKKQNTFDKHDTRI